MNKLGKLIIAVIVLMSYIPAKANDEIKKLMDLQYTNLEENIIPRILTNDESILVQDTWVQTLYYYTISYDNILLADLNAGGSLLTDEERETLIYKVGNATDAIINLEVSNNPVFTKYRTKFKKYYPKGYKKVMGWTYFNRVYYPKWPKYLPKKRGSNGAYMDTDHNNPPFTVYAVETGLALIAITRTADIYVRYGYEADAYISKAKEVMDYWNTNLYKTHDYKYIGWCFSEFCKTKKIGGVSHHEDIYVINSNSLIGEASIYLYRLTDNYSYLDRSLTVSKSLEKIILSGESGWNYGVNNRWWRKHKKLATYEHPEDTSHAGWDVHLFGLPEIYSQTDKQTIDHILNALYTNVWRNGIVYADVSPGNRQYSEKEYRLIADWISLVPAIIDIYGEDEAAHYNNIIMEAMSKSEKYWYTYNHQYFYSVRLVLEYK